MPERDEADQLVEAGHMEDVPLSDNDLDAAAGGLEPIKPPTFGGDIKPPTLGEGVLLGD